MAEHHPDGKEKNTTERAEARFSWFQVWSSVLARPATDTFVQVLDDPAADSNRAVRWVFASSFLLFIVSLIMALLQHNIGFDLWMLLSGIFVAIVNTMSFVLITVFIQTCARLAGGQGSIEHLQYAYASFDVPLRLIQYLVILTAPQSLIFLLALSLYRMLLMGMAIRAVHNFSWGKAILTLLIGVGLIMLFSVLLGLLIVSLANNSPDALVLI